MGDWLKWALVTIVQFVIGKRFYVAAWRALRNGSTNMDVLVALGTSASYFYSVCALLYGAVTGFWSPTYFETSAMLITFVLLGKYLETLAKGKTSDAIKKLVELAPATALLLLKDKGMLPLHNLKVSDAFYFFRQIEILICFLLCSSFFMGALGFLICHIFETATT